MEIYISLSCYEDFHAYLGLEEPHHDLKFLLTLVGYDGRGNILKYNVEPVHPVEVTEDWRDHSDMPSKEIEEYRELLWQLELTFEEESDDPSEDTP